MSKHVLVTGADGFIGSHLTEALVRRGDQVRALTFYNSFGTHGWLDHIDPAVRDAIEFVPGDIRDPNLVRNAARGQDVIFHLAALIAIPFSYIAPDAYVDTNVRGTLNVVQAARDLDIAKVVHTSTSEVYGTARYVPMDEEHPLQGQSPYSASKIGADQIALSFHRSFATPVAVIRPFNTYGPRQSARAVLPTVISQIAAGARTVRLGAIEPTRDFSFVADTVDGFLAVADHDASVGEVINVGSGFEVSIGDAVQIIGDVMGVEVSIQQDDARLRPAASEVERLYADVAKARALIGWTPRFAGLDGFRRGLELTSAWFQEPSNLAMYRPGAYAV